MKKLAILLSVLLCVVFFTCYVAAEEATGEVTEETVVSVSDVFDKNADDVVTVKGIFVGVSDTFTDETEVSNEILIKDTGSDAIIAVRSFPCVSFPDDVGYDVGDEIQFSATVKVLDDANNNGKKYLEYSDGIKKNSSGNGISFTLENPTVLTTWKDTREAFNVSTLEPYTLFKFAGVSYFNTGTTGLHRLHNNISAGAGASAIKPDDTRFIALQNTVMTANLGTDWRSRLFYTSSQSGYPGKELNKDFYVLYVGACDTYFYCVILDDSWVQEKELNLTLNQEVIKEVAYAYSRQDTQIEYDQSNTRRHVSPSPEDATEQHKIYLDCSSYVNSCYIEAFGINILPYGAGLSDGKTVTYPVNCSTSTMDKYAAANIGKSDDVIGYWTAGGDDGWTGNADKKSEIESFVREHLQVGDILNYRHGPKADCETSGAGSKGHVYIYVGEGIFLHRPGDNSYVVDTDNPADSYDSDSSEGKVTRVYLDELFDPTFSKSSGDARYLFKDTSSDKVYSFSLLRPLARGEFEPTEESKGRMEIAGLNMEKISSVYENSSVTTGQEITYTITLKNANTDYIYDIAGINFTDTIPEGTEYVSQTGGLVLDGNTLTWTGSVADGKSKTLTYTVKVTSATPGYSIISNSTKVNGVNLGKITHSVSTYSTDGFAGKYTAEDAPQVSFASNIEMVRALYNEAFDIDLFDSYESVGEMLDDLIDDDTELKNYTRLTDTELSKMIAPNLFGGMNIRYGHYLIPDNDRARLVSEGELAVGDIIVADWSGGDILYVYAGNSTLLSLEDGKLTKLTIGTDIYGSDADNILVSLYGYNRYAVLRPSMATTLTTKTEQDTLSITSAPTVTCGEELTLTTSGGSSGGDVIYTVTDGTGEAILNGDRLSAVKTGTVTVTAIKTADSTYNSASASLEITITEFDPLATITAQNGKIAGLDFTEYEYQISPVLMKSQGVSSGSATNTSKIITPAATVAADKWLPLVDGEANDTTSAQIANENLAGLYKIKCIMGESTYESYVYVDGTISDKKYLSQNTKAVAAVSYANNWYSHAWIVGKFSIVGYTKRTYNEDSIYIVTGTDHLAAIYGHPVLFARKATHADYPYPTSYDSTTETFTTTNGTMTADDYIATIEDYSVKYALESQEVIPTTDFKSLKYGVVKDQGSVKIGQTKTKLEIIVFNTDTGELQTYAAIPDTLTSNSDDKITDHVATAQMAKLVKADGSLDDTTTLASLGEGNYIVGYEIYAASGVDKANLTVSGTTATAYGFYVYYDNYDCVPTFDTPTVEMVDGDTLTVTNYNENYSYEYKESTAESWTDLTGKSVRVDKAGTGYVVRVKATDYVNASAQSDVATSHDFIEDGTSLVLGGEIGIKTTFKVADGKSLNILGCYYQGTDTAVDYEYADDDADGNDDSVIIYVPAKDKAKNFEYRYTYNDKTVTRSFETIASYIGKFSSEDVTENALISALDNYTDYSAVYFGVEGATADGDLSEALASASAPEASVDFTNSIEGFEYLGVALVLEGKTAIRHYFRADNFATTYTVTINGETVTDAVLFDLENDCYYVDVPDISAVSYDTLNTVEIEFADKKNIINYSVMNYLVSNVNKTDKPDLVNLVKAMYDYHVAAKAYAESLSQASN